MASEKKPSIYYDRGTIGSSKELDEYGVWVKSEPQVLSAAGAAAFPAAQDEFDTGTRDDLSLPDLIDLPDLDTVTDEPLPTEDFSIEDDFSPGDSDDGSTESFETSEDSPLEIPEDSAPDIPEDSFDTDFGNFSVDESLLDIPVSPEEGSTEENSGFDDISVEDFPGDSSDTPPETLAAEKTSAEINQESENNAYPEEASGDSAESGVSPAKDSAGETRSSVSSELSTQLLMKIADELASIRNELSTLKNEISTIHPGDGPREDHNEERGHGFFDEEDDEKIALTGDELENILNTADFTVENAEGVQADTADDISGDISLDLDSESIENTDDISLDLSSETAEISGDISLDLSSEIAEVSDDISLDLDSESIENTADLSLDLDSESIENTDDISLDLSSESAEVSDDISLDPGGDVEEAEEKLPPDEATADLSLENFPADSIPPEDFSVLDIPADEINEEVSEEESQSVLSSEDTSYLEEDPLALSEGSISLDDAAFDENSIDLSNAVIDEPDLGFDITENPLEEPSLDDEPLDEAGLEPQLAGETVSEASPLELTVEAEGEDSLLEEPGSFDLDLEESAEDSAEEMELSIPEDTLSEDFPEPELPVELPVSEGEDALPPEEENFSQVIPEGFVVEEDELNTAPDAEESPVPEEEVPEAEVPGDISGNFKQELKTVLSYMDQLLESLPEEKIEEFAKSEYFDTYKKLFKELGIA